MDINFLMSVIFDEILSSVIDSMFNSILYP